MTSPSSTPSTPATASKTRLAEVIASLALGNGPRDRPAAGTRAAARATRPSGSARNSACEDEDLQYELTTSLVGLGGVVISTSAVPLEGYLKDEIALRRADGPAEIHSEESEVAAFYLQSGWRGPIHRCNASDRGRLARAATAGIADRLSRVALQARRACLILGAAD